MPAFRDAAGRSWEIRLTIGSAERVRDKLDLDFTRPEDPALWRKLDNYLTVASAAYWLCEPQLIAAGVSQEQFTDALDGPAMDCLLASLEEAIVSFCRQHLRPAAAEVLRQRRLAWQKTGEMATAKLRSPTMDARLASELSLLDQRLDQALASPPSEVPPEEPRKQISPSEPGS